MLSEDEWSHRLYVGISCLLPLLDLASRKWCAIYCPSVSVEKSVLVEVLVFKVMDIPSCIVDQQALGVIITLNDLSFDGVVDVAIYPSVDRWMCLDELIKLRCI